MGRAKISMPGGCAIGVRPIDLHLKGMEALGAKVSLDEGYVVLEAKGGLRGAEISLDFPSVGATENIIMAACLAEGRTLIEGAAREPEIEDLCGCLTRMGAKIKGAGSDEIEIIGVGELHGCEYEILPDRIEAGTMMVAAAITGGDVVVENAISTHLHALTSKLREAGVLVEEKMRGGLRTSREGRLLPVDITTRPYPGFPTDMQAQMMVLMSIANGTSIIKETIFENRFMHVGELNRMGARIKIEGNTAFVQGVPYLSGAEVLTTDLRASAALVLAGLVAKGKTVVSDVYHLDRGYEALEEKLSSLGAEIHRIQ
jgi:UDP-N-acetylglucosamine 1-carboxyvinyltransferase